MTWIDYTKAYDFASHNCILECLDMLCIAENVRSFLEKSMKKWEILLSSNGSELCEVDINIGIFQGDSLSLLLRKAKVSYECGRKEFKLNRLLFMDGLKLFGNSEDQIDGLVQTVFIFIQNIGMELVLVLVKKRGVVIVKKGKLVKFCSFT